jgi:peptidoglycan-N-acetylglucosamine deacetylase
MKETIMLVSSILFAVLLLFLIFLFLVFAISKFFRRVHSGFSPKISVIIPAYNEEKNIGKCLESISASDYPGENMEVIVVDDGSTDKTLEIAQKYPNVRVLNQNHGGKVDALNLGTRESSSAFVLTIDADTALDKDCIKSIIMPFADSTVGATTGNNVVRNHKSIIGTFQNIEYHFTNLMRNSFSIVFKSAAWIAGSVACYRKEALQKAGYFKKDTMAEDIDVALELKRSGYKTVIVPEAIGYTVVPASIRSLYKQRLRWWAGTSQAIIKNRELFSKNTSFPILFLYVSHFWWSFYAFVSLPLILFQVYYWLPYNTQSALSVAGYLFRWFSLMGPVYVIYKIPVWGISIYSIFGVLSGVFMALLSISAIKMFKDKISLKNLFAIFFYFPYTIVLNIIILVSLTRHKVWSKSFYIK